MGCLDGISCLHTGQNGKPLTPFMRCPTSRLLIGQEAINSLVSRIPFGKGRHPSYDYSFVYRIVAYRHLSHDHVLFSKLTFSCSFPKASLSVS